GLESIRGAAPPRAPPAPRGTRRRSLHLRRCRRLIDVDVHTDVSSHDFAHVVARALQHLEPAVLPVAHAGQPRGAAATGPRLGALPLEVEASIPVEPFALPDGLDGRVVQIGEPGGGPERYVLTAESNPAEGIDVEPLERPDTRLPAIGGQLMVQVRIERLVQRDRRVVVPRQE